MEYQIDVFRVVKQVKTDSHVPIHSHPNYYHYIYVIGGKGVIYSKNRGYTCKEGMLFLFSPREEHAIYGSDHLNTIDIKFRCSGTLTQLIDFGVSVVDSVSRYESSLISEIFDEAVLAQPNFDHFINALMLTFLMSLSRHVLPSDANYGTRLRSNTSEDSDINAALDYIDRNLTSPISISALASSIGFSPSYFSTVFKRRTGYAPNQYINIKRVNLAKRLIMDSNMNITEISEYLSFESLHYFSRVFKKYVGISPKFYYKRANSSAGISISDGSQYYSTNRFQFALRKGDITSPENYEDKEEQD